jgi:hypothetical protein
MQKQPDGKKAESPAVKPWVWPAAVSVIFFVAFYLYTTLRIQPAIDYYARQPSFLLTQAFVQRYTGYAGGLADYAAAYLSQLSRDNTAGALVFTALNAILSLELFILCRRAFGKSPVVAFLFPPLFLLAWSSRYDGLVLSGSLRIAAALGTALVPVVLCQCALWIRSPISWLVGAALYYVAGPWALGTFAFISVWTEATQHRSWFKSSARAAALIAIPIIGHFFGLNAKALNPWGHGAPLYFAFAVFAAAPITFVAMAVAPRLRQVSRPPEPAPQPAPAPQRRSQKSKAPKPVPAPKQARDWAWIKPPIAIATLCAGWAFVWLRFDEGHQTNLALAYYAATQQDQAIVNSLSKLQTLSPTAEIRLHQALYHTHHFLDGGLFPASMHGPGAFLPGLEMGLDDLRAQSETLFELGAVNDAEHQEQESLEMEGERVDVLRMLANINIVKDRPEAAAVFLRILGEMPFERAYAVRRLDQLKADPRLTGDAELDRTRSRMPTTDLPHSAVPDENVLLQLLDSNPRNEMAYQYLMAYYLMTGNFAKLAKRAPLCDSFGIHEIPRSIEEALLLGQKLKGTSVDIPGHPIRPETLERFRRFGTAFSSQVGQNHAALSTLAPEYADTYWYYYYWRIFQ